MQFEKAIHALDGGRIMAEYGPMRMVISAWVGKLPQRNLCITAAREAFVYFERIAALKDKLATPLQPNDAHMKDPVAQAMIESVAAVGEKDLTPLAAVAGALADAVADFLFDRGMTRVVVNNGGDIAVRLGGEESITVGIGSGMQREEGLQAFALDGSLSSWGAATSGLGGRSFTRGVASAVTVLAETASLADAAATAVANASFVEDANVIQKPARELDPNTDIPDISVTVRVGVLSEVEKKLAVSRAMEKVRELTENGVILGAVVAVQDKFAADAFSRARLISIGHEGSSNKVDAVFGPASGRAK